MKADSSFTILKWDIKIKGVIYHCITITNSFAMRHESNICSIYAHKLSQFR